MAKPTFPRGWGAQEFNQAAREALADDNRDALKLLASELAARQLSYRRSRHCKEHERAPTDRVLGEDLLSAGIVAGCEYANAYNGENFYKEAGAVISNAMQEHLRAGGRHHDNAWKGGYDSHTRKFSSQLAGAAADGAPEPGEEPTEQERQEGERSEQDSDRTAFAERNQAETVTAAAAGAAERTDGPHADAARDSRIAAFGAEGRRFDAGDTGEAGGSLENATHGQNTGRALLTGRVVAWRLACQELDDSDNAFFARVEKVGLERYIGQNRQRQRGQICARLVGVIRHTQKRAREIIRKAGGEHKLLDAYVRGEVRLEGEDFARGARIAPAPKAAPRRAPVVDLSVYTMPKPRPVTVAAEPSGRTPEPAPWEPRAGSFLKAYREPTLPPYPHGERLGAAAWYEAEAARRAVQRWLAGVERYRGHGSFVRLTAPAGKSLLEV